LADPEIYYLIRLPNTVVEALKNRKRLPKKLYVHWRFFTKNKFYYAVTLGPARGKKEEQLDKENASELPAEIVEDVRREEERTRLEATAILWKITKWNGQTVALAKILFGYGQTREEQLQADENIDTITILPEIKYYLDLHGRTQLYWKHIAENTWLVSKDRKDYDAVTWNTWDTIKLPPAVMKELGFFTTAKIEIEFSINNDNPALIVRIKRRTTFLEDFLNEMLEENGKGIEIHELNGEYYKYLEAKNVEPFPNDFQYMITVLKNFHIISFDTWKQLTRNELMIYVIPNYGLKTQTNERGDGG
jgi:antitoxin component of MazEF toxin-antitoxin module